VIVWASADSFSEGPRRWNIGGFPQLKIVKARSTPTAGGKCNWGDAVALARLFYCMATAAAEAFVP